MPKRVPAAKRTSKPASQRPSQRARPAETPAETPAGHEVPMRITVARPPPGVRFCLQSGRSNLVSPTLSTGKDISFDFTVRVRATGDGGPPRFLGPFTQGPPDARFVYVCSGTLAGQPDSCWTRRAKVPLTGITWPLVQRVLRRPS